MDLLRDTNPEVVNDTIWKAYYDKGHEISESGAFCVNCNSYVINMAECFTIPECKGVTKMTENPEYSPNIISSIPNNTTLIAANIKAATIQFGGGLSNWLLRITPEGKVESDTLENACIAGKMFVESIRHHLSNQDLISSDSTENDQFLNKTEDLHLLSKIMDAMEDENISKAVELIHAVRKSDRDFIERLQNEINIMKEEYQERLLDVSTD